MNRAWYNRTTERQMRGLRVRAVRELRNGRFSVPAGTEGVVVRKFGGLEVRFAVCPHCGIQVFMSKIDPTELEAAAS